ncbi:hypothetical protein [Muricoccus pecuniae]|uniref:Uncharacterized protein n=1 Tax=Muricoccus pecuniae TaxID=693023 RepID=A0A840Y0E2_9PROT|nr:hypothetical protein [Roseomonas pecuniae]MBB5694185.1 hypothetical protein [Roseomonas pecuniae]
MLEALAAGWLAVVVGEEGAGKTLLLRDLERQLRAGGLKVRLGGPGDAIDPVGPDTVRLVDDADMLDDAALRSLALAGGVTVLAVLPQSAGRAMGLPVRTALARLLPLTPEEVGEFVSATLTVAGRPADLFSERAVAALASFSEGLPGSLSALCQASMLRARREGAPQVGARHVVLAAQALRSGGGAENITEEDAAPRAFAVPRPDMRRWLRPALLALPVLLVLALLGWSLSGGRPPASGEERPAVAAGGVLAPVAPPREPPVATAPAAPVRPVPVRPAPAPDAALDPPRAGRASPPADFAPRAERAAPRPEAAEPGTFRGSTFNVTLARGGGLRLTVTRSGPADAVMVRFQAYGGLIGAGQLAGRLTRDGQLTASGTLMMGQNPFTTELEGTISGDRLTGSVRYIRAAAPGAQPSSTRGTFRLARD